jgi:hypothetical protein
MVLFFVGATFIKVTASIYQTTITLRYFNSYLNEKHHIDGAFFCWCNFYKSNSVYKSNYYETLRYFNSYLNKKHHIDGAFFCWCNFYKSNGVYISNYYETLRYFNSYLNKKAPYRWCFFYVINL